MLEDIARELAGDVVFPTSFDSAIRLRRELQNADLPTVRIAQIVGLEPLIATKLMRLAGSVIYSRDGTPARTLQDAVSRLGVNLVRTTALAVAMNQLMRAKDLVAFINLTQTLWYHSLRTAAAARLLARTYTRVPPDEAMLAGLVHDLGAFYMLYRAAQYPELRARPDTVKHLIIEWHESIGVTLLNALGLSEEIVNAAIDHHQPRSGPVVVRGLQAIIYVASALDDAHSEWINSSTGLGVRDDGVVREDFAALLPEIARDAAEMKAIFS
jgi:putative nucleotidyltransferase with HDIG domain